MPNNFFTHQYNLVLENGFNEYFSNKYRVINYYLKRLSNKQNDNDVKKWQNLKDKYKGKRVFLIGNGPSLNKTPLFLLKNEYKMCFNHFYLMNERLNWKPQFYTIIDNLVLTDITNNFELVEKSSDKIFIPDIHWRGEQFSNRLGYNNENLFYLHFIPGRKGFSQKLPKIFSGGSVIVEGMQILKYLGFDEIILVGVDMNYKIHETAKPIDGNEKDIEAINDDDPNHFDARYFGTGKKYHQPTPEVILRINKSLLEISRNMNRLGFKVLNAGYDTKVECFEKIDIVKHLGMNESMQRDLFVDLIRSKTYYLSIEDMEKNVINLESDELPEKIDQSFSINTNAGFENIKSFIKSHLPLGPYRDKLYFIFRNSSDLID